MREHTEIVRPPRALWVTFELGRPLGVPDDAPFQRRVLSAALGLLERSDGPLIEDYPETVAEPADFTGWACPIALSPAAIDSLKAEIERLSSWYDQARAQAGRTTVGVSGLDMAAAGVLVREALEGPLPEAQALKEAVDDLRAYYLEAASAFPDPGTAAQRRQWFWDETKLARAILALQPRLAASPDPQHRILATLTLIPAAERHRLAR